MTINITNDSYLIIVYRDFENILISDFKEEEKEELTKTLDGAMAESKTSTGQKLMKLLNAGITSNIAQSMASKINLPNAVKGRIQSSLYGIIADGKVSNLEVAGSFIGSCTNELDSTAIAMGFPTPSALYEAIGPDGAGVISKDFLKHFQKEAEKKEGEKLAQRNKVAQDVSVLKFKLITGDSESWGFGLPSRKTEKGFNIIDAVERENTTRDFQISVIQGDYSGITDMYVAKSMVEFIADKKIPFDIYINDNNNKYTEILKHCFFTGVTWETEGVNCLNASINITKIPEYEVKTEVVEGGNKNSAVRKTGKATSSKDTSTKVKTPEKKTNAIKLSSGEIATINTFKREADMVYSNSPEKYKTWLKSDLPRYLSRRNIKKTPSQLGFTSKGGGKKIQSDGTFVPF